MKTEITPPLRLGFIALSWLTLLCDTPGAEKRPHVLFIAVDDLRVELGCYGSSIARSPHIDALARSGIRFDQAYCQQAICGPSRASVMTGLRPDAAQVHGNHTHFREMHPEIVTLPQHFKNHGYHTRSMGKIYHGVFPKGASRTVADTFGDELSWSVPTFRPGPRYYYTEEGIEAAKAVFERLYRPENPRPDDWTEKLVFGPATEAPEVDDGVLYDGQVADRAIASLAELAREDQPFFLAVGFIKPHSPYIAPKAYWDLYEASEIPLPDSAARETDAPPLALHDSAELRRYTDQAKKGAIPEPDQRKVRHAYLACVSYIDAQVGKVLDELKRLELDRETIVVLWSDHGYHLGEKGLWGKTTNFERDTRVPLVIRVPGKSPGVHDHPVELVDLYPTLAELAGLPAPPGLQGASLVRAIDHPESPVKRAAFSQFTRGGKRGYSMRSGVYRYTEWIDLDGGELIETLLFDLEKDPEETTNLGSSADPALLERLRLELARGEGWRKAELPSRFSLGWPFTDNLVLQQEQPNQIWGTAPPGSMISLTAPWSMPATRADQQGHWKLELRPIAGGAGPFDFEFRCGEETAALRNVAIGDVWICSGQSNMRWKLKDTEGARDAIASSANPDLRLLNLSSRLHPGGGQFSLQDIRQIHPGNLFETEGWKLADSDSVGDFSGVAYHFGRELQAELRVPIGLIHNGVGGSPMESWIRNEKRKGNWLEEAELPKWVRDRAALNLSSWRENATFPVPHHPFEPGILYQAGIDPLTGLGVKGVIWYQGESNATSDGAGSPPMDPKRNLTLHRELIHSWRSGWGDPELPFYLVQLPGLNRDWAAFREVQQEVDRRVPNTHLAITLDLGHPTNVHPRNKRPVGERLADLALKHTYERERVAEAPRFTGWIHGRDVIRLRFDRPVKLVQEGRIAVAGQERQFRKVALFPERGNASGLLIDDIDPSTVTSLRYAWENDPAPAIVCAETGLPVAPFRTDDWPLVGTEETSSKKTSRGPISTAPSFLSSFENGNPGPFRELDLGRIRLETEPGHAELDPAHAFRGKQCLRLLGGKSRQLQLQFAKPIEKGGVIAFQAERWTRRAPFEFHLYGRLGEEGEWREIYDGTDEIKVGRAFLSAIRIPVPRSVDRLRLVSTTPEGSGVLIDDLQVLEPTPMKVTGVEVRQKRHPVLIGKPENAVLNLVIDVDGTIGQAPVLEGLTLSASGTERLPDVESAQVFSTGNRPDFSTETPLGEARAPSETWNVTTKRPLVPGENHFWVSYRLKPEASLDREVDAGCLSVTLDGETKELEMASPAGGKRIGFALRQRGQDGVNSARIPGIATTNAGSLIAVYDNRNRGRGDLPGDIDVGMSRSLDGGQHWEPMRVIMDMGDDPDWNYDGIGDPAILVDRMTGTIWVMATWSHGNRSWHGSGPGLGPEETGQLMLAKSDDDGLTWSEPINITRQVKDPKWRFVLQGPGKGITLKDGTLVFPAQFRSENDPPNSGRPFSTLVYSKDRGETWRIGTGVQIDTTEAQLVELGDGSIMINCRDNRGGSRSIYTTDNLGRSWRAHQTDRSALPEPVCMASLIRIESRKRGPLLFFSNPPQRSGRHHMTIKVSDDEGISWPDAWHTLVDERATAYSCLTPVGTDHVGLLYEAPGELYYVRYRIDELLDRKD